MFEKWGHGLYLHFWGTQNSSKYDLFKKKVDTTHLSLYRHSVTEFYACNLFKNLMQ